MRSHPERIIERTIEALTCVGTKPEVCPTRAAGDATRLAQRAIAGGADLILAFGGDGTINEVANGMIPSRVPLGVLPGGTANVLAMELGLGSRTQRAAPRLNSFVERRIAVGRFSSNGLERYFLMMGGVGLDATIVAKVNPAWKNKAGKLAYWAAGVGELFHSVGQCDVRVNGRSTRCGFALAARVRNYGGDLQIAGGASLLNDEFELVTFQGSNPLRYALYFLSLAPRQVQNMPGVQTVHARRIELRGSAHVQLDGEYMGDAPASLEIVPDALTLLMPGKYR